MKVGTIEDILARIAEDPTDAEAFQELGKAYKDGGRFEEAEEAFERSLELGPDDGFTHLFLGNLFYTQELYAEAQVRFERGAELLPDSAIAHRCLGDVHWAQGRITRAEAAYRTADLLVSTDKRTHRKLVEWEEWRTGAGSQKRDLIFSASDRSQAATTVLLAERRLRTHPDDVGVLLHYAETLYLMTRYEEAVRVYLDVAARSPKARWLAYCKLGHLHRYRGAFEEAEAWYQKAVEERPDDAGGYIFLGAVQARQGKLGQAEAMHRAATGCSEGCIDEAHHNLGLVLRGQGRLSAAAESFRQAIALCPKYEEAIEALEDVEAALVLLAASED